MQTIHPKITQKLLLRSAIGILVLAGLVMAFRWYKGQESDPQGNRTLNTAGWIAATETVGDGRHVIAFKPDGTIVRQPGISPTTVDNDLAWRPDGNYIFFGSNREKQKFTIFRWFPDGSAAPEMRSLLGRPQSSPYFLNGDASLGWDAVGLVTAGGIVMRYEPKRPALHQELPPPDPKRRIAEDQEGGSVSPFEEQYERLGTSFRIAKWTPDRKAVFAVMRRDTGEILIYQKLDFSTPQEGLPRPVIAGDRIDFDVDQHSGKVYFAVQNFQWPDPNSVPPEFVKDGKVTVPFRHAVGVVDPANMDQPAWLAKSTTDKECFGAPAVDLAGDRLAFIRGAYAGNGNLTPDSVVAIILAGDQRGKGGVVAQGAVFEPAWSPDGQKLAFARRESPTSRPIYVLDELGATPRRLSPDTGVFGNPAFSPQSSSASGS
ncbi:MAG TPA: hypothetical protein VHE55_04135 [Fimbriimonadaceae bacterium]|nr:hypothetical protein [Fimbriimonadaceae bacterium]